MVPRLLLLIITYCWPCHYSDFPRDNSCQFYNYMLHVADWIEENSSPPKDGVSSHKGSAGTTDQARDCQQDTKSRAVTLGCSQRFQLLEMFADELGLRCSYYIVLTWVSAPIGASHLVQVDIFILQLQFFGNCFL